MKVHHSPANYLNELYESLKISKSFLPAAGSFSMFNLKDMNIKLPYKSPAFHQDFFTFIFVKDGVGKYTVDTHTFQVAPHSVCFANPGTCRTFDWSKIEEVYLITVWEAFLKEYVSQEVFEEFPFLLTDMVSPKIVNDDVYDTLEDLYLQIRRVYTDQSSDKHKIIGHLLAALLYQVKARFRQYDDTVVEVDRSLQIVQSFRQHLEKHYRDLSAGNVQTMYKVQDYADAQNLHPSYFSSVIKSKTGKPITTWIADKVIAEAKALLQHSSVSIKDITYRLGFLETAHFSNFFKKHTQMSPVHYRKNIAHEYHD